MCTRCQVRNWRKASGGEVATVILCCCVGSVVIVRSRSADYTGISCKAVETARSGNVARVLKPLTMILRRSIQRCSGRTTSPGLAALAFAVRQRPE